MKYLIDTHVLLWVLMKPENLSKNVSEILKNQKNQIFVSAISLWEISIKFRLKKLNLSFAPEAFPVACQEMDILILPLDEKLATTYHFLTTNHHQDPFDRMLIHTAIQLDIPLISKDENFKFYESEGLKVIW